MKVHLIILCLFISLAAKAQDKKGYDLVWHDEFDYNGLPSEKFWGYEIGHIRNKEQQYYTRARPENVSVENGFLTMTGRKEVFRNENYKPGSTIWQEKDSVAQYTSASINTLGKVDFLFGRVEVRAKMPVGRGMWPAIWMMGTDIRQVNWPRCGEIDIMEFIGNHPQYIYSTVHFAGKDSQHRAKGGKILDSTLTAFHIYTVEWTAKRLDFFLDERKIYTYKIKNEMYADTSIFSKPYYLLLNFAMGANWPGPIDDKVLPQQFVVDYVRYYKKKK